MRVMNQPVENGVSEGWICDDVIPAFNCELTCDDSCLASIAIIDDFHEITPLACCHLLWPPVIQDQDICPHDLSEQALETSICPGDSQFVEQPWHTVIEGNLSLSASLMTQGAGEP